MCSYHRARMYTKHVSIIAFYNEQKNILLQDRSDMPSVTSPWGFFGGSLEAGETKEQALVREIREELTYDLTDYTFIGRIVDVQKDRIVDREVFIGPAPPLRVFIQQEGSGMQFFSLAEARKLLLSKGSLATLDLIEKHL